MTVRKNEDGKYELVFGKRRLLCARLLRIKRVPCVKIKCGREKAALLRLGERASALPADCYETAEGLGEAVNRLGLSVKQAADGICAGEKETGDLLRLLELPREIRRKAAACRLAQTAAIALLILPPAEREAALDEIIARGFGEKQALAYVNARFLPKKKEPAVKAAIGDIRLFSNSVEKLLFTLSNAGFETDFSIEEEPRYINYTVRIKKKAEMLKYSQTAIC